MAKCACARSLSLLLTKHPEGFGLDDQTEHNSCVRVVTICNRSRTGLLGILARTRSGSTTSFMVSTAFKRSSHVFRYSRRRRSISARIS